MRNSFLTNNTVLLLLTVNTTSAGQLLCSGLFSADSLSTWFAAVALLHSIVNNTAQKEQLLRVQLATSLGNPPVSLLQQCTNILAQVIWMSHWYVDLNYFVPYLLLTWLFCILLFSEKFLSFFDLSDILNLFFWFIRIKGLLFWKYIE